MSYVAVDRLVRLIDSIDLATYRVLRVVDGELFGPEEVEGMASKDEAVLVLAKRTEPWEGREFIYSVKVRDVGRRFWFEIPRIEMMKLATSAASAVTADIRRAELYATPRPETVAVFNQVIRALKRYSPGAHVKALIDLGNGGSDDLINAVSFAARLLADGLSKHVYITAVSRARHYFGAMIPGKALTKECLRKFAELDPPEGGGSFLCFGVSPAHVLKDIGSLLLLSRFAHSGYEYGAGELHGVIEADPRVFTDDDLRAYIREKKIGGRISFREAGGGEAWVTLFEVWSEWFTDVLRKARDGLEGVSSELKRFAAVEAQRALNAMDELLSRPV